MKVDKEMVKYWFEIALHFIIASAVTDYLKNLGYFESFIYEIAVFAVIFFTLSPISMIIKEQLTKR